MAWSPRNQLGVGGARKLSATEASFNSNDDSLEGFQPFGVFNGKVWATPTDVLTNPGYRWIHTMVDGGGDAAQVIAVQDPTATLGPTFKVTTNDAQFDSNQFQFATAKTAGSTTLSAYGPLVAKAGYDIFFEMDVIFDTTVANANFLAGVAKVDTAILTAGASTVAVDDFVGFRKLASGTMVGLIRTGDSDTTVALTVGGTSGWTPTISTWYRLGFRVNGRTSVTFYVDGEETGTTTMTNLPANTIPLCPSFSLKAGTAAVAAIRTRNFFAAQEVK